MPQLKIYTNEQSMHLQMETRLPLEIEQLLGDAGISYKHIDLAVSADQLMTDEDMMYELQQKIMQVDPQHKFKACSLASVSELFPNYERLRLRYLSEYYIEEDEAYLIVEGKCLISVHDNGRVLQLLCEKGDFVMLPRKTLRWMDMGGKASFTVLKCSEQDEAPVIFYTGSSVADKFPRLEL